MIGERLKKLREENGFRQSDLANKLGVSQQTISQYEKDVREPDPAMSKKIAKLLKKRKKIVIMVAKKGV